MELLEHSHAERGVLHKPWEHTALKVLSFGGLTTAALAVAPLVMPWFSVSAKGASASAIEFCTTGAAKGFAGSVAGAFGHVPWIGSTIAAGGFGAALIAGGIAIGGMWLSNYVDKHTEKGAFRWGAVIRWGSLATSILVALPAILPAISMGLMFLGLYSGVTGLSTAAAAIGSLGGAGAASSMGAATSTAGLAALHALTCALPLGSAGFFLGEKEQRPQPKPYLTMPVTMDGRLTPPAPSRSAVAT